MSCAGRGPARAGRKLVYVGMSADLLHTGHLNVIEHAARIGSVMVGLLSDAGVAEYKRVPLVRYEERARLVAALKGVERVVRQETLADVVTNLRRYRPDVLVHGDDWLAPGPLRETRELVIRTLAEWGGELVEVPYTPGVSSSLLHERLSLFGPTPHRRAAGWAELCSEGSFLRVVGVAGAESARAVEAAGPRVHAVWLGPHWSAADEGLGELARGVRQPCERIDEVLRATAKPILADLGSGPARDLAERARELELRGLSAVCLDAGADAVRAVRAAARTRSFAVLARVPPRLAPGELEALAGAGAGAFVVDAGGGAGLLAAPRRHASLPCALPWLALTTEGGPPASELARWGYRGAVWPDLLTRALGRALGQA